jgi:hypothetical protein
VDKNLDLITKLPLSAREITAFSFQWLQDLCKGDDIAPIYKFLTEKKENGVKNTKIFFGTLQDSSR